jgi:hypothetical protein
VTTRDRDYQLMMTALADVARRRDSELENAEQAYQTSAAQAAGELARAEGDAISADRWAGAAASQVVDVDREAARLWDELRKSRRVRALGELPEPIPVEALPRVALESTPEAGGAAPVPRQSARTLLTRTAGRLEVTSRPARRRPLPRWALALLPLLGAAVAGLCGLVAAGLLTVGDTDVPGGAVIRGLGWLAFLIAPSSGLPVGAALAHRRLRSRLDIGGIGLTLLGGMVAATLLAVTFASSR